MIALHIRDMLGDWLCPVIGKPKGDWKAANGVVWSKTTKISTDDKKPRHTRSRIF